MNKLNFIFTIKHPEHTYIKTHQHGCYELVYYVQGYGKTQIGSGQYVFRPNTFAIIPPHALHDENHGAEDAVMMCIGYQSDHPELKNLSGIYEDAEDGRTGEFISRMVEEFSQQQDGFSEMLDLMVAELNIHLQRLLGKKGISPQKEDLLQYVINYMDEHFRQKIPIDSLAVMSGYSYDRFRHLFKERIGVSPLRYLLLKRLDYAKNLLLTRMLVSEIASEAGFVNDVQFCSLFKREIGLTPKLFRKTCTPVSPTPPPR
ncbi:AraC family transcriptional regulator [Paenibacillus mendelii]|uniref:Helix-turn-helix domain-containing protein n=1 Tax=Paenibacillus mendelii TaxID=206163 RepID=A0ABV6JJU4_9BACL|nr:helix-turn-helix domain-containing protein [Paenibacillus mendelii]MCQ6559113.1 helix-turn-helix domain-containing protein [Paenibacillus mendelii]